MREDTNEHGEQRWVDRRSILKPLNRRWIWLAIAVSVAVCGLLVWSQWGDTPNDHRSAFDVGWKLGAGVLAILAAVLGARRVELGEREHLRQLAADEHHRSHAEAVLRRQLDADSAAREDAVARQITELSSKASEQLGSTDAFVRIGGLTDLERLGQSHENLRQTVVDRICAYLRAPYGRTNSSEESKDQARERKLEKDVRRTAQSILIKHLRNELPQDYWPDLTVDLAGSLLIDFDFTHASVAIISFTNTTFEGVANFTNARFGFADFTSSTFLDDAVFKQVKIRSDCSFGFASFHKSAHFDAAQFKEGADFSGASFGIDNDNTVETEATDPFASVSMTRASLGSTYFYKTRFIIHAFFEGATFSGGSRAFLRTRFEQSASFEEATFLEETDLTNISYNSLNFQSAVFHKSVSLPKDRIEHLRLTGAILLPESTVWNLPAIWGESESVHLDDYEQPVRRIVPVVF
ncbi:pentapeptide repeat-containing protein [Amycolatopsis minnesotensis]|uniref:Pentapeptide repeat-containing protein n=1 Tax=Amycolatopsis minnesotensis TaxID=337894 RepID=A0ABN2R254_9PSEU